MDIWKLLDGPLEDLYVEDLDFFLTELATGDYSDEYRTKCVNKINEIKNWHHKKDIIPQPDSPEESPPVNPPSGEALGYLVLTHGTVGTKNISFVETVRRDLLRMRKTRSYKTDFKKYVSERDGINSEFIDKNYSVFQQWEIDTILSVRQMGEEFLEKYFGALDHNKIARYQIFSENFFMKHFSQLDATIVLEKGKNEWREKEKRSRQLDVFLRLKGVKI